jgi:hypothetical protein
MAADNRDDEALPESRSEPEKVDASASPGDTREEPSGDAPSAQTQDGIPSDPWAETEIRSVPPELSAPNRLAPGGTGILPSVEAGGPAGASEEGPPPRWSARAEVRTPDVEEEEVHPGWVEPPRGPLVPILVAVCILLLVALLGLGTWLIFANRPSTTPSNTPTVQTATPPPTSNTRTSNPATSTSAAPTPVALPVFRGQDYEKAAAELTKLGFTPVRQDVIDTGVPKGKVIGTDPPAGNTVTPGRRVTVFVSAGPPADTSPTASPSQT